MECHGIMNSIAINGALESFKKASVKSLQDTNELARAYAGSNLHTIGGGCNTDRKTSYNQLPDLELPLNMDVPVVGVQWPAKGDQCQCRNCTFIF